MILRRWALALLHVHARRGTGTGTARNGSTASSKACRRRDNGAAREHMETIRRICDGDPVELPSKSEHLKQTLAKMQSEGCRLNSAFMAIIKAYGRARLWDDAFLVLDLMRSSFHWVPDVATYRCLVHVLSSATTMDAHARSTLLLGVQNAMLCDGVVPDSDTAQALLLNLISLNRHYEFRQLFYRLKELGCSIPDSFRNTTPSIPSKDSSQVWKTWVNFRCLVKEISLNKSNHKVIQALDNELRVISKLDSVSLLIMNDGLFRLKKLGRMKALLLELWRRDDLSRAFMSDIVLNCALGELSDIQELWRELSESDFDHELLIMYLCENGEALEAFKVFNLVINSELQSSLDERSYVVLVQALCEAGQADSANNVVRHMKKLGYSMDVTTYNKLIQCCAEATNWYDAEIYAKEMFIKCHIPDVRTFDSLIRGLCKSKEFEEANNLFIKLTANKNMSGVYYDVGTRPRTLLQLDFRTQVLKPLAFSTYIKSLCGIGKIEEADDLLKKMLQKGWIPGNDIWRAFIAAFCKSGEVDKALEFCLPLKKMKILSNRYMNICLVHGLCEAKKCDQAMDLFKKLMNDGTMVPADICNALLHSLIEVGRIADANEIVENIMKKNGECVIMNVTTHNILLKILCDQRNVVEAMSHFQHIKTKKGLCNKESYRILFSSSLSMGQYKVCHELLKEMIELGHISTFARLTALLNP